MSQDFGIPTSSFEIIKDLLRANKKITEAFVFGSRAKGTYRNGSDIDIVIKGEGLSRDDLLNIQLEYDKRMFPWKLDLISFSQISDKAVLEHIERVGVRIL
jgi:predicted nucleotidyltransferase